MKILLIEDDQKTADYICRGLLEYQLKCEHVCSGGDGLALALQNTYALMIVDRMLPIMDGLSIVKKIREQNTETPILFLSALGDVDDRVEGLNVGADDYLAKPFAISELIARAQALVRRGVQSKASASYQVEDLHLDMLARQVTRNNQRIDLQPREFDLLAYLMENTDQVVTRMMLLENVWKYHFDPQTNLIDVHISRLRAKIDKPFGRPLLQTQRGVGYRLYALKNPAEPSA